MRTSHALWQPTALRLVLFVTIFALILDACGKALPPPIALWICLEARQRLYLAISCSRDWHSHPPKGPPLCGVGGGGIVHDQSYLTDLALKEAS
jgi:hypothetical protein